MIVIIIIRVCASQNEKPHKMKKKKSDLLLIAGVKLSMVDCSGWKESLLVTVPVVQFSIWANVSCIDLAVYLEISNMENLIT